VYTIFSSVTTALLKAVIASAILFSFKAIVPINKFSAVIAPSITGENGVNGI
jgi:hypothetical protein